MAMNLSAPEDHVLGFEQHMFGWLDHGVFMLMLAVSTGVGVYFGCFGNKQKTKEDYLLGGKSMSVFPVAISLVTSVISGIAIMGTPAEVYINGPMFWYSCIGVVLSAVMYNFIFLPMLFGLQLTSIFEYLEMRFNKKTRTIASILSTINTLLYIPIVVYVPSLAFSSVSGLSVHVISPVVCIICIIYTMLSALEFPNSVPEPPPVAEALVVQDVEHPPPIIIPESDEQLPVPRQLEEPESITPDPTATQGSPSRRASTQTHVPPACLKDYGGLKAVIWTDFIQGFLILGSCIIVIILGLIKVGGFGVVWERGVQGERIQPPSFDPNPLNRNTFWATTIGPSFFWLASTTTNQGILVKYLSLSTLKEARWALVLFIVGVGILHSMSVFCGFLVYAAYYDCDPLKTKVIQRPDQLLPFYVMDIASTIPILPGVFIAGIFSAALSSLSSCLNALSGTIYEDFIRPCFDKGTLSEERVNLIMRTIVVVIGTLCVLMVFVVEKLGAVIELNMTVGALASGALLGMFSLGALVPRANAKGAMVGSVCGMIVVAWLVTGSQMAIKSGSIVRKSLPSSVDGCKFNITIPTTSSPAEPPEPAFVLYRISFYYYYLIGTFVVMVIGSVVSYFTDPVNLATIKPSLFAPFLQDYIKRKKREASVQPVELQKLSSDKVIEYQTQTLN